MGFMGKVFNMLPQVQLAKWGINAGKQVYDNFKSGFEKDKIQGVVSFKKDKEEKAKQEKGVATNLPKTDKNTVIPPPFSGKDGKKGKDIGDKSGVNKTVEGSKPTVINVTFGAVTGANYLTQNLSGNDTQSKANEIVDLVVEQIIRRIGSSVAIAG
jgi:hypothetical protein